MIGVRGQGSGVRAEVKALKPDTRHLVANSKSVALTVVFWLIPALGLVYFAATSYGAITERRYASVNSFTGELLAGHNVGQTFVSRYDSLNAVELRLGTYGPGALADTVLHLRSAPGGPDIATVSVPASAIKGENPWYTFSFPPIANSQDRAFYLELESPNGALGKAVTLSWWKPQGQGDQYPSGTAYIDGRPQRGDLAFGLRYSPSPIEALGQVARAISANANPFLVIMLGVLFLFVLILLRKQQNKNDRIVLAIVLSIAFAHGLLYSLLVPLWQGPD